MSHVLHIGTLGGGQCALQTRQHSTVLCLCSTFLLTSCCFPPSLARFKESAAEVEWTKHNVFIPNAARAGKFNKVYVGAACPQDRIKDLCEVNGKPSVAE